LGALVDEVWETILEYHEEDNTIPPNPDVKQMTPSYRVTEVYDVEGFGLSVALTMDYSGSLGDDIYVSEDAARVFVRQMSHNDRAAIIKFTGKVHTFQDFTSDTALLIEAISKPTEDREFTALYDAVYTAIHLTLDQSGRRVVVAYTDGKDNYSSHQIDDVITYAKENEIPVYMIGLGEGVEEGDLQRIADETGGVYHYAESTEDLAEIYISIFGLIRGYYVLAHTSTDPFTNGTWRIVDLTLKHEEAEGRGLGKYYVPSIPSDVEVFKRATTDSVSVVDGDTLHFAITGDTLTYGIDVTNNGPGILGEVEMVDFPADSLFPFDFNVPPEIQTEDSVGWRFSWIDVGETVRIEYRCSVDTLRFPDVTALVNEVSVTCESDTFLQNNTDSATVYYIPMRPGDISVTKQGIGDSLVVFQGDSTWYVFAGDTVEYTVSLINRGELVCRDITVQDVLPEEATLVHFSGSSFWQVGDTLSWTVDRLDARGGRGDFTYTCRVDTFMPPWDVPLVNRVTVVCADDTTLENNTAQDTVWVAGITPPDPQIRVSPTAIATAIEPGDSVAVEVMTPVIVRSWDLVIFFEEGSRIDTYGDPFIQSTALVPQLWTLVEPSFWDTRMRTVEEEERVGVVFYTTDLWDVVRSDTAFFMIQSSNEFWLDENVFRPDGVGILGMRFKLNSNRRAEIIVYDISGGYVKKVIDGPSMAGWNFCEWDGADENGLPVGSGVYVAILSSGDFKQVRKFIIVR